MSLKGRNLIKTVRWDGSISLEYASFYAREIEIDSEIETGIYNIFGQQLDDIVRKKYKTQTFLIGGQGIRSFRNEAELKIFLKEWGFDGIMYTSDQIHKEIL